jgi:hypothetical protein
MNERIKELWERACTRYSVYETLKPQDERKIIPDIFAELIVRECLSIVENNNPRPPGTTIMYSFDTDEYFDTGWQVAVETKSNQIKRHLGVQE